MAITPPVFYREGRQDLWRRGNVVVGTVEGRQWRTAPHVSVRDIYSTGPMFQKMKTRDEKGKKATL